MNDDIEHFYKSLLQIIVKPTILAECSYSLKLLKLDLDEENLLPVKKVHLGFAAENEISKHLAAKDVDKESVKNL